jgi:hypothetical protein
MRLFRILLITICFFHLNGEGQTTEYKLLLDTAINSNGRLFVASKPISKINLAKEDIRDNYDDLIDLIKSVDTTALYQIITNCKRIDTLYWTDAELDKSILVKSREQYVQLEYVVHKFNLTDKKEIGYYRNQLNHFNSDRPNDKIIYYYSRPVFDNSGKLAIIQWDSGHSGLGGGGGLNLYKLMGATWKKLVP